jgi:hypothetical protein
VLAKLRPHLTYANVMATIAVFVAVSTGGAYAANTVFSTDIVDGEVKTPDIASQAVTGPKLKASAVTSPKILDNSLVAADLATDAVGSDEIAFRAVGSDELANLSVGFNKLTSVMIEHNSASIPLGGGVGSVRVNCPAGYVAMAGGARFDFRSGDLASSFGDLGGWTAEGQNNGTADQNLTASVLCLGL